MLSNNLIIAFGVTFMLLSFLQPLALQIGLVDRPSGHKYHDGEIPLTGGIAMFGGLTFALVVLDSLFPGWHTFLAASVLLLVVGILDDRYMLPTWVRFVAQAIAGLVMSVGGGVVIENLGDLLGNGSIVLGPLAIPFTVFCTIGVINAVNMIDGMDGLAGSLVLLIIVCLAVLAAAAGLADYSRILLIMSAIIVAFLIFNIRLPGRKKAKLFMGDAGSMLLGLIVVWFLIRLSQAPHHALPPVAALWLFAIPLLDTVSLIFKRLVQGRSPFSAGQDHLHHLFLTARYSVNQTLLLILLLSLTFSGIGLACAYLQIPEAWAFYSFLLLFSAYLIGSSYAWQTVRRTVAVDR